MATNSQALSDLATTPATRNSATRSLAANRTLGICWLLYGVFRIALAVWLIWFIPVATVMFSALLVRVANPFSLMDMFHLLYSLAILFSGFCGVMALLAGLALLSGWRSARVLGLIAAFLSLSELPLGITLGVYTLIALLQSRPSRDAN